MKVHILLVLLSGVCCLKPRHVDEELPTEESTESSLLEEASGVVDEDPSSARSLIASRKKKVSCNSGFQAVATRPAGEPWTHSSAVMGCCCPRNPDSCSSTPGPNACRYAVSNDADSVLNKVVQAVDNAIPWKTCSAGLCQEGTAQLLSDKQLQDLGWERTEQNEEHKDCVDNSANCATTPPPASVHGANSNHGTKDDGSPGHNVGGADVIHPTKPHGDGDGTHGLKIYTDPPIIAENDPKATNLAGQHFEIMQLGTFTFLSATKEKELPIELTHSFPFLSWKPPLLSLRATIMRAGPVCGATYIKNVTLEGTWISEAGNGTAVEVRAADATEKQQALQVALDKKWQRSSKQLKSVFKVVKKASYEKIEFDINGVRVDISIDAHRVRDDHGKKTDKWANFLNMNVKGVRAVEKKGVHFSGLLAYDDHKFATLSSDGCDQQNIHIKAKDPKNASKSHRASLHNQDLEEIIEDDDEKSSFLSDLHCE